MLEREDFTLLLGYPQTGNYRLSCAYLLHVIMSINFLCVRYELYIQEVFKKPGTMINLGKTVKVIGTSQSLVSMRIIWG